MRILHIIPDLEYSGSAKQLSILVGAAKKHEHRVCVLGRSGPMLQALAQTTVEVLGWTKPFNPLPLWRLRRLVQQWQPALIHGWKPASLRALAFLGGKSRVPVIAQASWAGYRDGNKVDRWLLRRANRVIARGNADADWLRMQGVASDNIIVIPPGVEVPESAAPGRRTRRVMCAGRLEERKGFYDAIWAVDILKHIYDDIQLHVIGEGPDLGRLEHFARSIGADGYVRFCGAAAGLPFKDVDLLWSPSHREAGTNTVLEAMSHGIPVVGSATGTLRELVSNGETGFLVQPQDKIALARCTRLLYDDAQLHQQFAAAAREHIRRHFSTANTADRTSRLYEEVAA